MSLYTLILLADIVGNLGAIANLGLFVFALLSFGLFIALMHYKECVQREKGQFARCRPEDRDYESYKIDYENGKSSHDFILKTFSIMLALLIFSTVVRLITPKERTLYILAGLKVSDDIVNSEMGKKTQDLIFKKIESYLNEDEAKKENRVSDEEK